MGVAWGGSAEGVYLVDVDEGGGLRRRGGTSHLRAGLGDEHVYVCV